jgi:hypothetical protein
VASEIGKGALRLFVEGERRVVPWNLDFERTTLFKDGSKFLRLQK